MVSWRQVDEAMCTVVGFLVVVYVVYTIDWLRKLVQEVLRQFWPRDRYLSGAFQLKPIRFAS